MFKFIAIFSIFLLFSATSQAAVPRVVVSIAPIHSLVSGVMDGVAVPELLVNGNRSPHGYMLKPSQVRSLQRADVIVWVGKSVEGFLLRPLENYDATKKVIELMAEEGMYLLDARKAGVWQIAQENHADNEHHDDAKTDGHLWLDPDNAKTIVRLIVAQLSMLDEQHAAKYQANGKRLQQGLAQLDQQLKQNLTAVSQTPYLVFHDAYQYFEQRYGLMAIGSIMAGEEHKPGARRIKQVRERVKTEQARCVFSEPQFPSKLIKVVTEGTSLKTAILDPMGMGLEPGEALYFKMMQKLGQGLVECLGE